MHCPVCVRGDSGVELYLDVAVTEFLLGIPAKCRAKFRKNYRAPVDQDDAYFARINPAIVREDVAGEVIHSTNSLHASETAANSNEGEHPLALVRVRFDAGGFQRIDRPGPEHDRVPNRLYAKAMFGDARNPDIVRLRPKRQQKVIKRQLSGKRSDP